MKYNTTYTQKVSLKKTVEATSIALKNIQSFYNSHYDLTTVIPPMFSHEEDLMLLDVETITRPITFDSSSEYNVGQLYLSSTNWLRSFFDKMEFEENQGLYAFSQSIWRDIKQDPISDISKNEIYIQIKGKPGEDPKAKVKELTNDLFGLLRNIENKYIVLYKTKRYMPDNINYITSQMLENEYPNITSPKMKENEMLDEFDAYVLSNAGDKLFSGHYHSKIPVELYVQKNFNQIIINNEINNSGIKVASIAQIANGQTLSDQLRINGKQDLKVSPFYSKQIKNDYNMYEIKINISRVVMALLQKGHIAEVQPGTISEEADVIAQRYKIEKY